MPQEKELLICLVTLVKNTNFAAIFWSFICYLGIDNVIQEVYTSDIYII